LLGNQKVKTQNPLILLAKITGNLVNSPIVDSPKFTFFSNLLEADIPQKDIIMDELVGMIKAGAVKNTIERLRKADSKEDYKLIKKSQLPCVTLSGTFTHRDSKSLIRHSGYMQVDLDNVPEFDEIFENISYDIYTLACFKSPGGNGIKVIVKINPSNVTHTQQFYALERYYKENYNIEIDRSCKDVARAMLLSYDPNIVYNPLSLVFTELFQVGNSSKKEEKVKIVYQSYLNPAGSITELVEAITKESERRCIDLTKSYADWIKIGFALCAELGSSGKPFFRRLSARHPEYQVDICSELYDQLMVRNTGQVSIGSLVYLAKEKGIIIKKVKKQLSEFELRLALQDYRTKVYKNEDIFAYEVFNNKALEALVKIKPQSSQELLQISGFNEAKIAWLGNELLQIINIGEIYIPENTPRMD
jgi:hypothetical protein